jgi:Trypsin-like peptidase domain
MPTAQIWKRSNFIAAAQAAFIIMVLASALPCVAALLPKQYPDAVVALGSMKPVLLPGQPCTMQWVTEGTGFLYGYLMKDDPDPKEREYGVYLVTNRHVIEGRAAELATSRALGQPPGVGPGCSATQTSTTDDFISVRMNPANSSLPGQEFDLPLKKWFVHPNRDIDIAAVLLNGPGLHARGVLDSFFRSDVDAANKAKLRSAGVVAGDGVFVLGFPVLNLPQTPRNYVIVRQGCIARITDMLDGDSPTYLVDAFIFPGNSGSPVVLKPDLTSIVDTSQQRTAYLIGIVSAYQPYIDVAISPQTKRPRITFEENSGLAEALPTDYIDEAVKAWLATQSKP